MNASVLIVKNIQKVNLGCIVVLRHSVLIITFILRLRKDVV